MENNEITKTEEIITEITAEAADKTDASNGFTAAAVGIGMLAGMLIYKYAVIPISARIKAKKATANTGKTEACDIIEAEDETDDED